MCNSYVVITLGLTISVSVLMGTIMSSPNVAAADLGIHQPEPWPMEHYDDEGKIVPVMENGRWTNFWRIGHPSPLKFFASWIFGQDDSNIPGRDKLADTLPVKRPYWMSEDRENFTASRARMTWLGHATVLAEVDGVTVLADPIFSTSRIRAGWSLVSSAIREEITGHDSFTSIVISHGESHSIAIIDRVFVSL